MQFSTFISAAMAAAVVRAQDISGDFTANGVGQTFGSVDPDQTISQVVGSKTIVYAGTSVIINGTPVTANTDGNIIGNNGDTITGPITGQSHATEVDVSDGTTKVVADGTTIINGKTVGASAPTSAAAGSASSASNSGNAAPVMTRGPSIELAIVALAGGVAAAL